MSDLVLRAKGGDAKALRELISELTPIIANQALVVESSWSYYYELDDVVWIIAGQIPSMLSALDVEKAGGKWKNILAAWCRNRLYNLVRATRSKRNIVVAKKVNMDAIAEIPSEEDQRKEYTQLRNMYFKFIRQQNLPQKHAEIFMATYPIQGVEEVSCAEIAERWGVSRQRTSFIAQKLTEQWKEFYLGAQ